MGLVIVNQYLATELSTSQDQASMPPFKFATVLKPERSR